MLYTGSFKDINDKEYRIEIKSGGVTTEIPLKMGETPAVITSNSGKLFEPIKSRALTLEIYTTEWYLDLYEPSSRGTSVKLYEYDESYPLGVKQVLFKGYLTPCVYDQSFTYADTIQLEAVDGISTAKDFSWQNNNRYNSVFDIITSIIKSCNYRGTIYVPQSYSHINNTAINTDVLSSLYISSTNFLDDNEERTPWTDYEVMEEIMQFLGWSFCPFGDDIWLVDYRAENAGNVTYSKYTYNEQSGNFESDGTYSSSLPIEITKDNMSPGESNISIDDIYNKIEISDNLYKIDEISEDIFDDGLHISVTDEMLTDVASTKWTKTETKKFLWWTTSQTETITGWDYQTICRLNPKSGWRHRYYRMSTLEELPNTDGKGYFDPVTWSDPKAYKTGNGIISSSVNEYCNTHGCLLQHYAHLKNAGENNVPSSLDWNDVLTFFVMGPTMQNFPLGDYSNIYEKEVLVYNISEQIQWKPLTGTSWITIGGSLFYQNGCSYDKNKTLSIVNTKNNIRYYTTFPVDNSVDGLPNDMQYCELRRRPSDPNYGLGFSCWKMKLQIGDKYWAERFNSSTHKYEGYWTTTPSYFYIRFNNNPDGENDEFIPVFQWMDTVNNMDYKDKVGVDAYAIKIDCDDDDAPSFGNLTLTICTPSVIPPELWNSNALINYFKSAEVGFGALAPVVYVKDFELGYVYTDESVWWNNHEDSNNIDKVYIGKINETYVNDFDNIEFKINTAIKDKPISRSFVSLSNSYLNTMKHVVGDESKSQEYNVIDQYLDHHSERKVIYNRNMHGLFNPNQTFSHSWYNEATHTEESFNGNLVIDNYSFDIKRNDNTIKFIEF